MFVNVCVCVCVSVCVCVCVCLCVCVFHLFQCPQDFGILVPDGIVYPGWGKSSSRRTYWQDGFVR